MMEHIYILIPYPPDRYERVLEVMKETTANNPGVSFSFVLYQNDYIGFPNAVRNMIEGIDGYVFLGSSDIVLGKDALKRLWEVYERVGKIGAIEPYNEIQHGRLCQHCLCHSSLLKEMISREYIHYYVDNEMTDRLRAKGLYFYEPNIPMEHRHYLNGKAPMDKCYQWVQEEGRIEKDHQTYIRRQAQGWPEKSTE